ncbi:unnamed protein product [Polarella glacialis]|uniref:Uncharacterized protein n=1 Tax=Polarella glacialis TaxID=89957 RepID=A0A813DW75_POLGL|nr:unnamed protein product [Polarella glacialis]
MGRKYNSIRLTSYTPSQLALSRRRQVLLDALTDSFRNMFCDGGGRNAELTAGRLLVQGQLPLRVKPWLDLRYITVLAVRADKVRGIAPGDRLRLHAATSLLSSLTPSIGPVLSPWHHALCVPAGTEAFPLLANVMLEDDCPLRHDHVLVVIDIGAAFGTQSRVKVVPMAAGARNSEPKS